jgi:PIN domain nuclease of toxin-antitoxin system
LVEQAFEALPVDIEHSVRAGLLPMHHRDPFDRLIVAQAQIENAVIVSADRTLDNYDIKRIW